MPPDWLLIFFVFALGACVGSFLNVVVWRLPRNQSLITPPSHCPRCNVRLAWYDNIPIFGWMMLRGRCRYCREPISIRYPTVETITGLLFAFYYIMFFILQVGPCASQAPMQRFVDLPIHSELLITRDGAIYALYMLTIAGLLAASLIDAELFIIPIEIPWLLALVGVVVHAIIDQPALPGSLNTGTLGGALAAGGTIGLLLSIGAWWMRCLPTSFPQGEPILEVDRELFEQERAKAVRQGETPAPLPPEYTPAQIRLEIGKEALFLLPPVVLSALFATLAMSIPRIEAWWSGWIAHDWFSGLLGALLGALIGALVVWMTRILGTLAFGRVAMGLGDVHLMFGVGAVIGAGPATVAFFLAPFFGLALAVYMLITGKRRELPYGPYLSLATAFVMLYYCPIADYLRPGIGAMGEMIGR